MLKEISLPKKTLRISFGEIKEIVDSIGRFGLLYPIVLRSVKEGCELVAGNRLFEICRRLGGHYISCLIVELNDDATKGQLVDYTATKLFGNFGDGTITEVTYKYKKT